MNLGAGAIVKQDLLRINDAIADGSFFENEVLTGICERARSGPRGRLHLLGLVSDGGVHSGWSTSRRASSSRRPRGAGPGRARVHRRPRHAPRLGGYIEEPRTLASPRRPDRHGERALLRDGPRPSLGAHEARLRRDRARGRPPRREPSEAVRSSHERGETDEFVRPTVIGTTTGSPTATRRCSSTSAPIGCASSSAPSASRTSTSFPVGRPRSRDRHDDRVPGRVELSGRVPAQPPKVTLASVLAERGERQLHVADGEVRPRDLLLQRREGGGVAGGGSLPRRLAPRRSHLRPPARDERRGCDGGVHRALGARRVPVRAHQLREPGHGRPHW